MPKVTLKEIADLAGVSLGTVDRVVNNRGKVKPATEKRIRKICGQVGYESNALAKALVLGRKETRLAIVVPGPDLNVFTSRVKAGFDAFAAKMQDYNIGLDYLFLTTNGAEEMLAHLDRIETSRPAGLVIKPIDDEAVRGRLEALAADGMPIVTCTSDLPGLSSLCFVGQDHEREGQLAANMLAAMHRAPLRVAAVVNSLAVSARKQRVRGFLDYVAQRGLPFEMAEVFETGGNPDIIFAETYGLLKRHPDLGALYVNTANLAATLKAVEAAAPSRPLDVFAFGCREETADALLDGRLAFVIEEHPFKHGYEAGMVLFNHLFLKKRPDAPRLLLECGILLEKSVDP